MIAHMMVSYMYLYMYLYTISCMPFTLGVNADLHNCHNNCLSIVWYSWVPAHEAIMEKGTGTRRSSQMGDDKGVE
jgi:hypothetical protein